MCAEKCFAKRFLIEFISLPWTWTHV